MKLADILTCGSTIIIILIFAIGLTIVSIQDTAQSKIDCMDISKAHNLETRITGGKCQASLCGIWVDTYDIADFDKALENSCK